MNEKKLKVLAVNEPDLGHLFQMSEAEIAEAISSYDLLRENVDFEVVEIGPDIREKVQQADAVIGWDFNYRETVPGAESLKWIHIIGAGYDHLRPFDWVPEGVVVTNSSGVHRQRAGEYIACALLMLNSRLPQHVTNQRKKLWHSNYSDTIDGKTVTIFGVGMIGSEGARRAKQLGLRVRGVRSSAFENPHVDEAYSTDQLEEAVRGADFLVITASLNDRTQNIIDGRILSLLNPEAGVVNISRAALLDHDALVDALNSGHLRGAILDVFDPEPLPEDSDLWHCDNLVITPHSSSDPANYVPEMLEIWADNCRRLIEGEELINQVP